MASKNRFLEDIITTLDDRDNIELYLFDENDRVLETLQSALEESHLNKKRDGGAQ
jgi:hypothetical protein